MGPTPAPPSTDLRAQFGEIDIYLFDQLLRGRFDARRRVLDAGCGAGRNLPYFLSRGFEIYAIDEDPGAALAPPRECAAASNGNRLCFAGRLNFNRVLSTYGVASCSI